MTPERQALIDMVPLLQQLEDGACESYPGEACCGSCETLGSKALDLALNGLSEYPGQTRWTDAPREDSDGR